MCYVYSAEGGDWRVVGEYLYLLKEGKGACRLEMHRWLTPFLDWLHMVRVCRLAALGQNSRHHFTRELHPGPLTGGLLLLVYFVWWIFAFICDYGIFCLWWFWSPVEMVEAWLNKLSSSLLTVCIYPTKNFAFIFKVLKGQRDCQQVKLLLSKPCDLS